MLLIHGWQATADLTWFSVFEAFGGTRSLVAADLRGHGRSLYPETPFTLEDAADDHAALLTDLGIERVVVVGYSIGSAVAQVLVERHPHLVAGMILLGGELAPSRRPHEKAYVRSGGWHGTALRLTTGRWGAHRLVDKAVRDGLAEEDLRGWLVTEMERGHSGSLRAAGRALTRFDGRPIAARRAQVPVVIVITQRDKVVRPARQQRLARAWRAQVVELDADHDAPVVRPGPFSDAVLAAVEAIDAQVSGT